MRLDPLEANSGVGMSLSAGSSLDLSPDQTILVVDDEPTVRGLLCDCLSREGIACEVAATGREAAEKLKSRAYAVVITDIRMPELNGLELVELLESSYPDVVPIMITAVADLDTAVQTMKHGACDYITKPFDLDQVLRSVKRALNLRHARVQHKESFRDLQSAIHQKSKELNLVAQDLTNQQEMTLRALMKALDARGHETQCHSQRVQAYTIRLAQQFDFQGERMVNLARAALLHDIGKIGVPDRILLKPGKLTPEELTRMQTHAVIGYEILKGVQFLEQVAWTVLCHHERYDGRGYPQGLQGEKVPLESRIFAVLDAYDAMTSDRPYREALSVTEARSRIVVAAGAQFDDLVISEFLKVPQADWDRIKAQYNE